MLTKTAVDPQNQSVEAAKTRLMSTWIMLCPTLYLKIHRPLGLECLKGPIERFLVTDVILQESDRILSEERRWNAGPSSSSQTMREARSRGLGTRPERALDELKILAIKTTYHDQHRSIDNSAKGNAEPNGDAIARE